MKNRFVIFAASILTVTTVASCSGPAEKPARGTLPRGTAQFSIGDKDAGATNAVQCSTVESMTTIRTGDDASGATVMVSNAKKPAVLFVRIHNISGFTGGYDLGLQGDATLGMTATTYDITGTAFGYSPKSFEPTTQPFQMKAAC